MDKSIDEIMEADARKIAGTQDAYRAGYEAALREVLRVIAVEREYYEKRTAFPPESVEFVHKKHVLAIMKSGIDSLLRRGPTKDGFLPWGTCPHCGKMLGVMTECGCQTSASKRPTSASDEQFPTERVRRSLKAYAKSDELRNAMMMREAEASAKMAEEGE